MCEKPITNRHAGSEHPPGSEHGDGALVMALEREHREIDAGIEAFLGSQAQGLDGTEASLGSQAQGIDGTDALRRAIEALRRHIYLEEVFLFPALRNGGLVAPIFVMLREHGEIWDTMDGLDAHLRGDAVAGPDGENCRELLAQLERHNSKEEAIIYPQAATLSADAAAALSAFLASGQMPEGWVCQQAGS